MMEPIAVLLHQMTNKEVYEALGISKKGFYNNVKKGMPKDIKGAEEWLKERAGFTDRGSGKIDSEHEGN